MAIHESGSVTQYRYECDHPRCGEWVLGVDGNIPAGWTHARVDPRPAASSRAKYAVLCPVHAHLAEAVETAAATLAIIEAALEAARE